MYSQIESNKRKTWLLILLFIAFIALIGWVFSRYSEFGYGALMIAFAFSFMMALISYYRGDKVALWAARAKPIVKKDNPYIYRIVENLCLTAGLPMPKVHIIPDKTINAFATGRDPKNASIAVTEGAIEKLENEELEGVIAHELSHIKNYDIRLTMIVVVLVGLVVLLSDWFLRITLMGGLRGHRDSEKSRIHALLYIVGLVLLILSPLLAQLIQLAVSRKRELLADASGALLTRYPQGLANALEKISRQTIAMRSASNATAHLYISNPFGKTKKYFSTLFNTHPPIEERIKILRGMA